MIFALISILIIALNGLNKKAVFIHFNVAKGNRCLIVDLHFEKRSLLKNKIEIFDLLALLRNDQNKPEIDFTWSQIGINRA